MGLDTFRSKEEDFTAEIGEVKAEALAMQEAIDEGCGPLDRLVYEFDYSQEGLCSPDNKKREDFLEAYDNLAIIIQGEMNTQTAFPDKITKFSSIFLVKYKEHTKYIIQQLTEYNGAYENIKQYNEYLETLQYTIRQLEKYSHFTQDDKQEIFDVEKRR